MHWRMRNRECTGFLIMPKGPYEWRVDSHGCYKFNNADLALGSRDTAAHHPVFLHLRTTNFPGPDSITRSEQAQERGLERKATRHERRQSHRRLTKLLPPEATTLPLREKQWVQPSCCDQLGLVHTFWMELVTRMMAMCTPRSRECLPFHTFCGHQ